MTWLCVVLAISAIITLCWFDQLLMMLLERTIHREDDEAAKRRDR